MIEPTEADIGRKVIYTGNRFPGGKPEYGVITHFTTHTVFVRYGGDRYAKGTNRLDLEWDDGAAIESAETSPAEKPSQGATEKEEVNGPASR